MPARLPPIMGIPGLLDKLHLLEIDTGHHDQNFNHDAQRAGDVLTPADNPDLLQRLAGVLGMGPSPGETLGSFWYRQAPNALPPSLREPVGHDIELPSTKAKKLKPFARYSEK